MTAIDRQGLAGNQAAGPIGEERGGMSDVFGRAEAVGVNGGDDRSRPSGPNACHRRMVVELIRMKPVAMASTVNAVGREFPGQRDKRRPRGTAVVSCCDAGAPLVKDVDVPPDVAAGDADIVEHAVVQAVEQFGRGVAALPLADRLEDVFHGYGFLLIKHS